MEQEVNGNVIETFEVEEINKNVFLLFAEFLGYESPFIEWVDKICDGEKIEDFQQKILDLDASYIFKKMQEEYSLGEIRGWYNEFYDAILKDFDNKLKESVNIKSLITT